MTKITVEHEYDAAREDFEFWQNLWGGDQSLGKSNHNEAQRRKGI